MSWPMSLIVGDPFKKLDCNPCSDYTVEEAFVGKLADSSLHCIWKVVAVAQEQ